MLAAPTTLRLGPEPWTEWKGQLAVLTVSMPCDHPLVPATMLPPPKMDSTLKLWPQINPSLSCSLSCLVTARRNTAGRHLLHLLGSLPQPMSAGSVGAQWCLSLHNHQVFRDATWVTFLKTCHAFSVECRPQRRKGETLRAFASSRFHSFHVFACEIPLEAPDLCPESE